MGVRFSNDGILYCSTIKYNWKQAKNMFVDLVENNKNLISKDENEVGYKSGSSLKIGFKDALYQSVSNLEKGHLYYISFRHHIYKKISNALICEICGSDGKQLFKQEIESSSADWTFSSLDFVSPKSCKDAKFTISIRDNEKHGIHVSRFIMIDLTATFGEGKEPTMAWCDKNIREHEIYTNFGKLPKKMNKKSSAKLDNGITAEAYYFQVDTPVQLVKDSQVEVLNESDGFENEIFAKRLSFYGSDNSFTNKPLSFEVTNTDADTNSLGLISVGSQVLQYNFYNDTKIALYDVNKEWCDRWIECKGNFIIHIKDSGNPAIKFNRDYDVICNDIEIRPEVDKVIFDYETGTIICRKLIQSQKTVKL